MYTWIYFYAFYSAPLIFVFVFLGQYHTVLIIIALYYHLKPGTMMLSALFFSLNIAFGSFAIPYKYYDHLLHCCGKCYWNFGRDCIESEAALSSYGYFSNILLT